jgi:hypothetical protein
MEDVMTKAQAIKRLVVLGCTNVVPDGKFCVYLTTPSGNRSLVDPRDFLKELETMPKFGPIGPPQHLNEKLDALVRPKLEIACGGDIAEANKYAEERNRFIETAPNTHPQDGGPKELAFEK